MVAAVAKTARSGIWCRIQTTSGAVAAFEAKFAELLGAKFCVATGSGTQSLHTCVEAMGIGPGDEVITSPYTDPGTIASILAARALPVLADLDRESFQLDPADVEKKINGATKALMPVHMMGQPCDMQSMMSIAGRHGLRVIEDACQAHLAQHGGKRLGTIGDVGCFSFQSSKTLACGEGGAIVGNDEALMDACYTVHNHGTSRRGRTEVAGPKYRMNEFEAAILLAQMPGLMERFERRNRNAAHLTARLRDCPGIVPQKLYAGTESGSFYLYAMTYRKEHFEGASRGTFLKALAAEGVDLSPYIAQGLHREPWIDHIVNSKIYRKMYSPERLARYRDECACPRCDAVCQDLVMLWASGPLLGSTADMDDVADAILKVYEHRSELASI
jgi:dTDP-4-amino-4,6-dideoxygalactose transaminase